MPADFPTTELWRVIAGEAPGRRHRDEVTLFDSVGFAIADFSTLRYLAEATAAPHLHRAADLLAQPADPRDLFGFLGRLPVATHACPLLRANGGCQRPASACTIKRTKPK